MATEAPKYRTSPFVTALRAGSSGSGPMQARLRQLQWRQEFTGKDHCLWGGGEATPPLRVEQVADGETSGLGTGANVWPAAMVLMAYMERCQEDDAAGVPTAFRVPRLRGRRVVDVGAGTGILGIAAACLGAEAQVCDQGQLLDLLERNVAANRGPVDAAGGSVRVAQHDWGVNETALEPPLDVVFVSDCVLPKLYPIEPLVAALDGLLGDESVGFFSYERRFYPKFDPKTRFAELCGARGIAVDTIPLEYHHPNYRCEDIELWVVRRGETKDIAGAVETSPTALRVVQWGGDGGASGSSGTGAASPTYEGPVIIDGAMGRMEFQQSNTIGATAWISSVVLSRYALELANSGVIQRTTRVLELGSGVGVLAAVLASPPVRARVTATDRPSTLALLEQNLEANGVTVAPGGDQGIVAAPRVALDARDWNDAPDVIGDPGAEASGPGDWDLVMCADCIYERRGIRPLLLSLLQLCPRPAAGASAAGRVLIANYERSAIDDFLQEARRFFDVVSVPCAEAYARIDCQPSAFVTGVRLLELRRRA